MNLMNGYIPREYMALKINYCRQQLKRLPNITMQQYKKGDVIVPLIDRLLGRTVAQDILDEDGKTVLRAGFLYPPATATSL